MAAFPGRDPGFDDEKIAEIDQLLQVKEKRDFGSIGLAG